MTIHVDFIEHKKSKSVAIDYTFLDRHTGEELAFGTYNDGQFELMNFHDGGIKTYASAAVAWTDINRRLVDEYGY